MEVVERDKVALEESAEEAEVDAVGELVVQVVHLEVDLVQVLVHERHQRFFDHLATKAKNVKNGKGDRA